MTTDVPAADKLVPISEAARLLNVSIPTIRRWADKGLLSTTRLNGRYRYFSLIELEKVKATQPLTISEAAHELGISATTLRRLEESGQIKPQRGSRDERLYTSEILEEYLRENPNARRSASPKLAEDNVIYADLSQKLDKAVGDISEQDQTLMGSQERLFEHHETLQEGQETLSDHKQRLRRIQKARRRTVAAAGATAAALILGVVATTSSFLTNPEATGNFFGYRNLSTGQVLGITSEGTQLPDLAGTRLGRLLQPLGDVSLGIVREVNPAAYYAAVGLPEITNAPEVVTVTDEGVVENLDSDYVRGREPGTGAGNLLVLNEAGNLELSGEIVGATISGESITDGSITAGKLAAGTLPVLNIGESSILSSHIKDGEIKATDIADGAISGLKIADGAVLAEDLADSSVTAVKILDGSITNTDIDSEAAIADNKLAQITSSEKVAGGAIQLAAGGGLTNNSGLSLVQSCTADQVLSWNGSSWGCGTITAGAGDITSIVAGSGLIGGATSGDATLNIGSGTGITVGADDIAINQAFTPTWTGLHTFSSGLTSSGLTVSSGTVTLPSGQVDNSELVNSSLTVSPGTGLSGGGAVSLGGSTSLSVDQSFSPTWTGLHTFSSATPLAFSSTSPAISIGNTGTLSLTDGTNTLFTLSDSGTTGTASVGTLTLTGTGTLNGLDVIDATGEATLESTLDVGGEVVGTGLGSVAISCADCLNATEIEDVYLLNTGDTATGDYTYSGTLTATGDITLNDSSADAILIGQAGATDDVVTIAGDISFTDDQWSISTAGLVSGLSGTLSGLTVGTASDLVCTNCIGGTEIDESSLSGLTAADLVAGSSVVSDAEVDNSLTLSSIGNAGDLAIDLTGVATRTLSLQNSTVTQVANLDLTDGSLFTAGTSRLTNAGVLQNIAGITSTGAITLGDNSGSVVIDGTNFDVASGGATTLTGNLVLSSDASEGLSGAGLSDCDGSDSKLLWDTTTNKFSCGTDDTGTATAWDDIADADAAATVAFAEFAQTLDWNTGVTAAGFDGLKVTITNDGVTDSNTQRAFVVQNLDDVLTTGTTEALIAIDNADANEAVTDGLLFANSGGGGFADYIDTPSSVFKVDGSGNVTLVDLAISGGNINPSAALTIGDNGDTLTLDSSDWDISATGVITGVSFDANGTGNSLTNIETADIANGTIDADDLDTATVELGPSDEECLTFETSGGGDFEWQSCGGAGANWDTIGDPSGAGSIAFAETAQTLDWNTAAAAAGFDGFSVTLTNDAAVDVATQNAFRIDNLNDGGSTGITESLLVIDNSDTNEAVVNAIEFVDAGGGFTNLFNVAGTAISATEFTRLDGKNAALVDENDLTSGDGAGATSSGSGLEAGTGGIGLLQGCSNGQILEWNDSSAVWQCANDDTGSGGAPSVKSVNDTTTESLTSTNTVILDDGANTYLAITPSATTNEILVMASVRVDADAADSEVDEFQIRRTTDGSTPSCSSTQVGSTMEVETTAADNDWWAAGNFVDTPGVASEVRYTICGRAGAGTGSNDTNQITLVLMEVNVGADLAEVYNTNDTTLGPGELVSLDPSLLAGVKRAEGSDNHVLGIISTRPSLVMGAGDRAGESAVPVALAGRVPVKVTAENGPIRPGDFLSPSSTIPGAAQRASAGAPIVAQALNAFEAEGIGVVTAFVRNTVLASTAPTDPTEKTPETEGLKIAPSPTPTGDSPDTISFREMKFESGTGVDLKLLGQLAVTGGMRVEGPAEFLGSVLFKADVAVEGRPTFNKDTAGFARLAPGQTHVDIVFEREYSSLPVITANLALTEDNASQEEQLLAADYGYVVSRRTAKGFRIIVSKPAEQELIFSWVATSVKDARMFEGASDEPRDPEDKSPETTPPPESSLAAPAEASGEGWEPSVEPSPEPSLQPEASAQPSVAPTSSPTDLPSP